MSLSGDFNTNVRNLKQVAEDDRVVAFADILRDPAFIEFSRKNSGAAGLLVKDALEALPDSSSKWKGLMTFIQTEPAQSIAGGVSPETLVVAMSPAVKAMSAGDRSDFLDFVPMTKAGEMLYRNYPAARIKLRMG